MLSEDTGRANRRWVRAEVVAVAVPAAVMLAIGLWGLDRGGMWGDESVTFLVGRRTVPQIWQLLHGLDAVHGLYYLFMHVVLAVDPSEVVLRLPSVCGAAATAGLVAALGVRLVRPRVGLWAGLLYAVTPLAGHYAQEGRSYALVAAGVAGATLLLVRAVEEPSRRGWWWYAGLLAVTCLLHELVALVLCAHALTLALLRVPREVWLGWGRAAGLVGAVLLPLVWVSQKQSAQVGWLVTPGWDQAGQLVQDFAVGPEGAVFWVSLGLMVLGLGAGRPAAVALPLLVLPPALLIAVSQIRPLYHERYVLYALAGAPLLAAAGAEWVVSALVQFRPSGHRLRYGRLGTLTGVLAVALAFVQCLPLYRQDRTPGHRPENLGAVAARAARDIRPGDPVLFLPSNWRLTALTYPKAFRRARDIALRESGPRSGTLSGIETTPAELRRRLADVDRVWVVGQSRVLRSGLLPADPTERVKLAVVEEQFIARERYVSGRVTILLYVRRPAVSAAVAASNA
ncbi:glycosyltransferase family 39 protein [Streptomyces coacervatus]|uniref:Glycosyltransferase family 39 protein n=1 Tax=Streptomyces coacervatus TaxID=647381 RepID=A0ABP7IUD9_9ACTN|nr:glycosyltransferase family 39 protein [Streptomyces coacervatus]MDF2266508.1 glycosyltransferase family 39 protein [Streptomyces coacervatus]